MGKILLDIVLHSDGVSDERINELFNQENWKQRTGFKVMNSSDMIGCELGRIDYKNIHSWVIEPQKVFRKEKSISIK